MMTGRCRRPRRTLGDVFVSTNSLTKAYGLAGLRCGWIIASPAISERVREMRDVIDGSGPYVAERLSLTAFEKIDRLRARARQDSFRQSRCGPRDGASPIRGSSGSSRPPARPRSRASAMSTDTTDLVDRLIRDHDTIVVPGHFFQAPQHIRIAFGGKADMVKEAVARLDQALVNP